MASLDKRSVLDPRNRWPHGEINIPASRLVPMEFGRSRYAVIPKPSKRLRIKALTVCVAAICEDNGEPKIVLCADTRLDFGEHGSADGTAKMSVLWHGWCGMLAGDYAVASDFIERLKKSFQMRKKDFGSKESLRSFVVSVATKFMNGPLYGKEPVEIIIAGFIHRKPVIVAVRMDETAAAPAVFSGKPFHAIGSGANIVNIFLGLREVSPEDSMNKMLYVVYEAKKASEKNGGVGPETRLVVIAPRPPDADAEYVMGLDVGHRGLQKLEEMRRQHNLQPITNIALPLPKFSLMV